MGLNLHRVTRSAIQRINPDVPGGVYVSTGATTNRGIRTPTFAQLRTDRLQVQATPHEVLHHLNALAQAGSMCTVYAYGALAAVSRPAGRGGDLVQLGGEWWAVQHVLEWWEGWCAVTITRQVNAETLAALLAALANGAVPIAGGPTP